MTEWEGDSEEELEGRGRWETEQREGWRVLYKDRDSFAH